MGDNFDCMYDGILRKDFWENKATMGQVLLKFDHNPETKVHTFSKLMLKA
jgi:hypothetical protein